MLYEIQIRAHGWPRNRSHGFALEVGVTALERWGLALSSIYTGLVASGWLSKWEQQLVARRLWCTDLQLGCLVWWLNPACSHERYTPNNYWASIVRDSWLDVPWSIGCIFMSPNPHPAVGYMKQKPALVWPMDLVPCP